MKNVGDGKVVLESCDHQHYGGEEDDCKAGNTRTARGFTQAPGPRPFNDQRQQTCQKRIGAQGQRKEKRKTTYLRHGGNLGCIVSEAIRISNREGGPSGAVRRLSGPHFWQSFAPRPGPEPGPTWASRLVEFTPMRSVDDSWWREFRSLL